MRNELLRKKIKMTLAPIALFVYNRPEHTQRTLEALAANDYARESHLYVFCDGPRIDASIETIKAIEDVSHVVRERPWCGKVTIQEAKTNLGLANSIKSGVTQILKKYHNIIVLEDDIVTAKGFLRYMNDALNCYEKDEKVMHIGSYLPYTKTNIRLPETFFSRFMNCWGWATWRSSWNKSIWDANFLYNQLKDPKVLYQFNLEGVLNFNEQLERNIDGSIHTWAIMWFSSVFLNKGLCLYPNISLSENIGLDGSGENCEDQNTVTIFNKNQTVTVTSIKIEESKIAMKYLKRYYLYGENSLFLDRLRRQYIKYRYMIIKLIIGKK